MKQSKETEFIKTQMLYLNRDEKIDFIRKTNLTDREAKILYQRFVTGLTLCEIADNLNMQLDTLSKMQRRIFKKIYLFQKL